MGVPARKRCVAYAVLSDRPSGRSRDAGSGRTLAVQSHVQGRGPSFEMPLSQPYQGFTSGIANHLDLYACRCGRLTVPLKSADYLISDLEGQAFARRASRRSCFYLRVSALRISAGWLTRHSIPSSSRSLRIHYMDPVYSTRSRHRA